MHENKGNTVNDKINARQAYLYSSRNSSRIMFPFLLPFWDQYMSCLNATEIISNAAMPTEMSPEPLQGICERHCLIVLESTMLWRQAHGTPSL